MGSPRAASLPGWWSATRTQGLWFQQLPPSAEPPRAVGEMRQTAWAPPNYAGAWGSGHWLTDISSPLFSAAGRAHGDGTVEASGFSSAAGVSRGGGGRARVQLPSPSPSPCGGAEPHSHGSQRTTLPAALTWARGGRFCQRAPQPPPPPRPAPGSRLPRPPRATVPQLSLPLPLLRCQGASSRGNSTTGT